MRKLIRILGIIVIISILLGEAYFRIFYHEQLKSRVTATNCIPDSIKVFDRKPNVEETYNTPGVYDRFRINNMGYVGPDFKAKKAPGVFRIIVVGNSNVVGKQMNGGINFCTVLQKIFDDYNMNVEVINCAREGGNKDIQNMNIIKDEIINYQPDLVLLENVGRVLYTRYVYEGYRNYTLEYDPLRPATRAACVRLVDNLYKYRFLTRLYDMSYIVRAFCKNYVDKHSDWDSQRLFARDNKFEIYLYTYIKKDAKASLPTYNVTWDYASKELNKVISKLDSINCKLVLFTYGSYSIPLKLFFQGKNINFIELKMNDYKYLKLNSKLEGHINEIGHALIAERLFSQLIINNYIPKKIQQNGTDN